MNRAPFRADLRAVVPTLEPDEGVPSRRLNRGRRVDPQPRRVAGASSPRSCRRHRAGRHRLAHQVCGPAGTPDPRPHRRQPVRPSSGPSTPGATSSAAPPAGPVAAHGSTCPPRGPRAHHARPTVHRRPGRLGRRLHRHRLDRQPPARRAAASTTPRRRRGVPGRGHAYGHQAPGEGPDKHSRRTREAAPAPTVPTTMPGTISTSVTEAPHGPVSHAR